VFRDRALGLPPLNEPSPGECSNPWGRPLLRLAASGANIDRLIEIIMRFSYLWPISEIKECINPLVWSRGRLIALTRVGDRPDLVIMLVPLCPLPFVLSRSM